MSYLEELLPEFRNGAKIRKKYWQPHQYLFYENGFFKTQKGIVVKLSGVDFEDDWEFYKDQEPIDWDYIINNKCPCWFWDGDEKKKCMGILKEIGNFIPTYKFINHNNVRFKNCRPVPRDEVTFYEEKEDD